MTKPGDLEVHQDFDEVCQMIDEHEEIVMAELICLKCLHRWVGVYPLEVALKDVPCAGCGDSGYVIETGQEFPDATEGEYDA